MNKMEEKWDRISAMFEKYPESEQALFKAIFEYAYNLGFNTGYSAYEADREVGKNDNR